MSTIGIKLGVPNNPEASTTALAKLTEIVNSVIGSHAAPYEDITE